jgi:hypothetical protein
MRWPDVSPDAQAIMRQQIAYAWRYWVSLDPATRRPSLHPRISLDPDDFEVDVDAVPAFIAWAKLTTMTVVNELSGWNRDHGIQRP